MARALPSTRYGRFGGGAVATTLAITLACVALLGACDAALGPECQGNESSCADDHTLRVCSGSRDFGAHSQLESISCERSSGNVWCTTTSSGSALCTLERTPSARCNGATPADSWCDDGGVVRCEEGYLVRGDVCPGQCVAAQAGAPCAVCDRYGTAVVDSTCAPETHANGTCAGGGPHLCQCGYRVGPDEPCAAGTSCVVGPTSGTVAAFCAPGSDAGAGGG